MITYKYPFDGLTVKQVHALHKETLFFELLFPIIEQQADDEDDIFGGIAENWAIQELRVLGFISTFHLWERQMQELFLEQKEISGIELPKIKKKENIIQFGKRALLENFDASAPEEYWLELDKARAVVNAFKHGPSNKFDSAMKNYPEYFYSPEDNLHLPIVSISPEQLRTLINTVASFWEALPRKIDYS
jgi:hypothetical protein